MNKKKRSLLITSLILAAALLLSAFGVSAVLAEESVEFTGEVTAIDETASTLTLEVEEDGSTTSYPVLLPTDFDYTRIEVGDTVEVEGTLNDTGEIVLSDLDVEGEDEGEFTGEVTAIDETAGTLTLEVEEDGSTTTYTVLLPEDFDYTQVEVGDTVEVEGTLNDAGEIVLSDLDVDEEEMELTGEVTAIDETAGTLTLEVEEDGSTTTYTVLLPEDFDYTQVEVGDTVEVEGTLNDAGEIVLSSLEVEEEEDEEDGEEDGKESSFYCENLDASHPAGASIASTYGVDYEQVMAWFCEDMNLGFGEIKHALRTSEKTGASPEEILSMREDGMGWGQIWKEFDLIGKDRTSDADPSSGNGRPEDAGPPEGKGKPEHAGPPEGKGNNK